LYELVKTTKERNHGLKYIQGNSWLYNIEPYRRLFPKEYLKTAQINLNSFHGYALWGQFLDKRLEVKTDLADQFYKKLEKAKTFEETMDCFQYKVLSLRAEVEVFLQNYKWN
jgi:hypothetical protein